MFVPPKVESPVPPLATVKSVTKVSSEIVLDACEMNPLPKISLVEVELPSAVGVQANELTPQPVQVPDILRLVKDKVSVEVAKDKAEEVAKLPIPFPMITRPALILPHPVPP